MIDSRHQKNPSLWDEAETFLQAGTSKDGGRMCDERLGLALNTATSASRPPSLLAVWSSQRRTTHRLATRSGTAMCTSRYDLHRATEVAPPLVVGFD